MNTLAERMHEANVRIETLIWTGGIAADAPESFTDFINDELHECTQVLAALPWLKAWTDEGADADEVAMEFGNRDSVGFLAQLARPIPRDFSADGKSHSSSWGHYQLKWVFVKTLEELCDIAETFSEEVVERERAKIAA